MNLRPLLHRTTELAADFLDRLDERPVRAAATVDALRAALSVPLSDEPLDPIISGSPSAGRCPRPSPPIGSSRPGTTTAPAP